jgi:imidazolonepropionase-like amidohydrolase
MKEHSEFIVKADSILTEKGLKTGVALGIKDGNIDDINDISHFHRDRRVLNFTGYRVTPCFCDYHLHFFKGASEIEKITAAVISQGITRVYEGGDRNRYSMEIKGKVKDRLDIKTAGYAIYKKGTYGEYIGRGVSNSEEAKEIIDRLSLDGVDYVKVINSGVFLPSTGEISSGGFRLHDLEEIIDYANAKGLDVACHANGERAVQESIEAGVSWLIHGLRVSGEVLTLMAEKGIKFIPTVHAFFSLASLLSRRSRREPEKNAQIHIQEASDQHLATVKKAYDMGVKILPGSDSGPAIIPYGSSYHKELALFRKAGIPDEMILSSAAAGSLKLGAKADFLVLDGLTVKKVFISGRCIND